VSDKASTTAQAIEIIQNIENAIFEGKNGPEGGEKLKQLFGSILDDEMFAKSICLRGACDSLWMMKSVYPISLKILAKLAEYQSCAEFVLVAVESFEDVHTLIEGDDDSVMPDSSRGSGLHMVTRLLLNEKLTETHTAMFEAKFKYGEGRSNVYEKCLQMCICALKSKSETVRRCGVDCTIRVVAESKERAKFFVDNNGLNALLSMIAQFSTPSKETKEQENVDKKFKETMQQVSIILGRVLPSLKDDELIKKYALSFTIPTLKSTDIWEQKKGCAALISIFMSNKELGMALIEDNNNALLNLLVGLATSAPAKTQALVCEIFANIGNTESGRGLLNGGDAKTVLQVLVQSDTPEVRSGAAVALAKMNAVDFKAESNEGAIVLHSVMGLLKKGSTQEERSRGVEAVSFVITDTDVKMSLCTGAEGMAVLSEMVNMITSDKDTAKSPYAYGLAYCFENLTMSEDDKKREKLREMEVSQEQWEQFEKLTKSGQGRKGKPDPPENVETRIKAFVQADGAAALRALVLEGGSSRVLESVARTYCNMAGVQEVRAQMFAQGAARALIHLATKGASANSLEDDSSKSRRDKEQQHKVDEKTKRFASHALGKMFITTDPRVIGHNQIMDSIAPMVRQVRHSTEDLVIFECCMALTNLATLNHETKRKIITCQGVTAFEYASYSDETLVRRAAVEAMCNLVPEPEMVEWFKAKQHMRVWLLYAGAYEDDVQTSSAATGALAGVCHDPEVAQCLKDQEEGTGIPTLVVLLMSGISPIIHRVAVCLMGLLEGFGENGKDVLLSNGIRKGIDAVLNSNSPIDPPAKQAVEALNNQLK